MRVLPASVVVLFAMVAVSAQPGDVPAQPPVDSIYDLPALIKSLDLPRGARASLLAKAASAIQAYESGWPDELDVVNHLNALAREIRALAGNQIPSEAATRLGESVAHLITTLGTPIITCSLDGETFFPATMEECAAVGGAVQECVPPARDQGQGEGAAKGQKAVGLLNYTETDFLGAQSGWIDNLTTAVGASGIPTRVPVPGTYTCVDFTSDMQTYLNGHGYTTSFTVVYKKDAATGKIKTGHAIVDVRASDGTVVFVDPQNGHYENLDFDGDGAVEVATGHPTGKPDTWPMTDDNVRIEVYKDRAAARKAGLSV